MFSFRRNAQDENVRKSWRVTTERGTTRISGKTMIEMQTMQSNHLSSGSRNSVFQFEEA